MSNKLRYVKIDRSFKESYRIEEIYNKSFPPEERFFSIQEALKVSETMSVENVAAFDGDVLVGFYSVSVKDDYKYLNFFAVDDTIRNKGYGSIILQKLLDENKDIVFFASIEKPIPDGENYDVKLRRQKFYERNGMVAVNLERVVNGNTFIAVTNKTGADFERCYKRESEEQKYIIEELTNHKN